MKESENNTISNEKDLVYGLPNPHLPTVDQMKNSLFNLNMFVDNYVASLEEPEKSQFIDLKAYETMDPRKGADSLYATAYGDDEYEVYSLKENVPRFGAPPTSVVAVTDKDAKQEYVDSMYGLVDLMEQSFANRTDTKEAEAKYATSLYQELDYEEAQLAEAKKEVERLEKEYAEQQADDLAYQYRENRAKEALQKALQEQEKVEAEVKKQRERLKSLPEVEDDGEVLEYNPFNPVVNRKQVEAELEHAKEREKQLKEEIAQQQKLVNIREDTKNALEQAKKRVKMSERSITIVKKQVEADANPDRFDEYKQKAKDVANAMIMKRTKRAIEGYPEGYLATRMPFDHGINFFGPSMNLSDEPKTLTVKIAESQRVGYPVYDTIIQTDLATDTIIDYWKAKEKGSLDAKTEDGIRRKLYDQVCQIEHSLETMYRTSEDPVKNADIGRRGICDTGNRPFHQHKNASRGTMVLYSASQAYKTGLENNWEIDDCNTLFAFKYLQNSANRDVKMKANTDLDKITVYKEPKYIDGGHKKWIDDMNKIWEKVEKTPLQDAETRANLLEEMRAQIQKGYEAKYIAETDAKCFVPMYAMSKNRDKLIEKGKEKPFVVTENLRVSAKARDNMKKISEGEKNYDQMHSLEEDKKKEKEEQVEEKKEQEKKSEEINALEAGGESSPEMNESFSFMNDDANKSFVAEDPEAYMESGGKIKNKQDTPQRSDSMESGESFGDSNDWRYAEAVRKFTEKRSAVFFGRESDEHKNLRESVERMNDMRYKAGGLEKLSDLKAYIEALDEVVYRSRVYEDNKEGANTPAGKKRLEGAKEIRHFATDERNAATDLFKQKTGKDLRVKNIREVIAEEKAEQAEKEIRELCEFGIPESKNIRNMVAEKAADILAASFVHSAVPGNENAFHIMGRLAIKHDIMESKEFAMTMKAYFDKEGMTPDKLIDEMKNGNAMAKMSKLHKKLTAPEADKQKNKELQMKKEIKKPQPGMGR